MRLAAFFLLARAGLAQDLPGAFEHLKRTATPAELYRFLWSMPKGGDIHHHLGLSLRPEWLLEKAIAEKAAHGYEYVTRVRVLSCASDESSPPLLWRNLLKSQWEKLEPCRREEYKPLADLDAAERARWVSALKIDRPGEGRNEFFEVIVPRYTDLIRDPYVLLDGLVELMGEYGRQGLRYLETQFSPGSFVRPDGSLIDLEEGVRMTRERLARPDALATGVTVRFQAVFVRFLPDAEQRMERAHEVVAGHPDLWVGVNMAGREDNDRGHPARFQPVLRRLRRTHAGLPLSLHAGEKDAPGRQVRETLMLGARRIGHGLNLISDPETMLLMRNGPYLVEINLVSNRVLEYFPDLDTHPFPEYLRLGIPVCLNTDDQGVWDSNITDEYMEAVRHFGVTWDELVRMGRASLEHSFAQPEIKRVLLEGYDVKIQAFERDWRSQLRNPRPSGYAQRTWKLSAGR
jgi:adenosine deaminase CECR1